MNVNCHKDRLGLIITSFFGGAWAFAVIVPLVLIAISEVASVDMPGQRRSTPVASAVPIEIVAGIGLPNR